MPAPRTQQSDVREEILREATRLFATRGFDGTAVQDIAECVGIKKPSLLYHFPSKDALRAAVLEQMLGHWRDVLPRVLLAATTGEGQFDGVVHEVLEFFSSEPDRARLLMRELLDRPDEMSALISRHVRPWVEVVADYIRKGQAQGRLRKDADPEAYVTQMIVFLVAGVASNQALRSIPEERHLKELLRMARSSLFLKED